VVNGHNQQVKCMFHIILFLDIDFEASHIPMVVFVVIIVGMLLSNHHFL
jgi:hypothetical protein